MVRNLGVWFDSDFFSFLRHVQNICIYLFGVLHCFQHSTGHITRGSWKGRENQYIQFFRVLYCKLPTNGKQLPAFPLEAVTGTEPRPQRWEVRVLPLCHRGPQNICKSCFAQIWVLKHLKGYLTCCGALMAANAVVVSPLEYCNSLFRSLSALDLRKLQCVLNSLARIVTNTTKYSHITPSGRLYIGCLLNTVLYSRLPCWCTSSYRVVIQNTLHFSLNLDILFITYIKAKLMVCSLTSHTLPLQYISLLRILASALLMMFQRFGIFCLMMYFCHFSPLIQRESQNLSQTPGTNPGYVSG